MPILNQKLAAGMHVIEDGASRRHFQVVMFDKDFVQVRLLRYDNWHRQFFPVLGQLNATIIHPRQEFFANYHR